MTARHSMTHHNRDGLQAGGILNRWADRAFQRRQLAGLDRRMLSDIGVSMSDRDLECSKPFWKA